MPGAEFCDNCTAPVRGGAPKRKAPAPDDPFQESSGGDLELEVVRPRQRRAAAAPPAAVSAPPVRGERLAPAEISSPGTTMASGGTGQRGIALYDVEVQRVADFGSVPDGVFAAIPYTLHVLSRRRALRREVEQARLARKSADAAARRAMIDLGRELLARSTEIDLGEVGPQLEGARRAAGHVDTRTQEQKRAEEESRQKRAELDERIRAAQADTAPWRDRETRVGTQHDAREAELSRVRARLKRIQIEIRNLRERVAQGQPLDESRLAVLEADAEARRAEEAVAESPVRELAAELADARRELAARTAVIAELEDERRNTEATLRSVEGARVASTTEAGRALDDALLALAEEAHVRGLDEPLAPEATKVETALAQLEDRRRREELHRRAVDAYDKPSFKKGAAILATAAALILAMLVFAAVR